MKEEIYLNLGKSLHVFNEIELFISLIIIHHIKPKNEVFFLNHVLNSSVVSFGAKIKILINLGIFNNSEIDKIRELSKNRNTFAHSNKRESVEVDNGASNSDTIGVTVNDVIFQTNSGGKLVENNYMDFVEKNKQLQSEVIDIIREHIVSNQINTIVSNQNETDKQYYHIENLEILKEL